MYRLEDQLSCPFCCCNGGEFATWTARPISILWGKLAVHTGKQSRRPLWPLLTTVTLASVILYVVRERGDRPWPIELGVFVGTWVCMALFALLGRALFRRREG